MVSDIEDEEWDFDAWRAARPTLTGPAPAKTGHWVTPKL